jgi:hypothetical protein
MSLPSQVGSRVSKITCQAKVWDRSVGLLAASLSSFTAPSSLGCGTKWRALTTLKQMRDGEQVGLHVFHYGIYWPINLPTLGLEGALLRRE